MDEDVDVVAATSSSRVATPIDDDDEQHERYDREAWIEGFRNVDGESCYALELPSDFPKDIRGTFFQNGHSKFYVGGNGGENGNGEDEDEDEDFHIHPFDADGMITALTLNGGNNNGRSKAWFRNRYVQTEGYLKELKAGKVLYRGVFGTARNKGRWWSNIFDLKQKNPANTHVLFQPNNNNNNASSKKPRMYALWEGGLPHEIDPLTLETLGGGETDLDGTLDERYAAHYKIDPDTRTVCNFCINVTPPNSHTIQIFEHDVDTMELLYKKDVPGFPGIGVSHDCAITKDYFVFLQAPTKFDPLPFVLGQKGPAQCIENDDDAVHSKLILIPRGAVAAVAAGGGGSEPIVIETPKMFTFHLSNAFQETDGDGRNMLVVDMILADSMFMAETGGDESYKYPTRPIWETFDFDGGPKYQLRRVRVDLTGAVAGGGQQEASFVSMESMTDGIATVEFPVVNPAVVGKPYRYAYVASSRTAVRNGVVQGVAKVDVQEGRVIDQWRPQRHEFLGEVVFCPREGTSGSSSSSGGGDDAVDDDSEDDGYLMTFLFNGKERSSELVVFDAKDVGRGPLSRVKLASMMNFALHGVFVPGYAPEMNEEVVASFEALKVSSRMD